MRHEQFRIVNDDVRRNCLAAIQRLPDEPVHEVIIKPFRKNRSLAQNRLYWMWLREIRDFLEAATGQHYSDEELHDFYRKRFLPTRVIEINGETDIARKSTRRLTVKQFSEYLERLEYYCLHELQEPLYLTRPPSIYDEAMGR